MQSLPGGAADADSPAMLRAVTIMRAATMARAATTLARSASLTRRSRLTSQSPPPPEDPDPNPNQRVSPRPGHAGAPAHGAQAAGPDRSSSGYHAQRVSEPSGVSSGAAPQPQLGTQPEPVPGGVSAAAAAPRRHPSGASLPAETAHDLNPNPGMAPALFSDGPGRSMFVAEEHLPRRAADASSAEPRAGAGKGLSRAATRAAAAAAAVAAQASGEPAGGWAGSRGALLPNNCDTRCSVHDAQGLKQSSAAVPPMGLMLSLAADASRPVQPHIDVVWRMPMSAELRQRCLLSVLCVTQRHPWPSKFGCP